MKMISNSFS